MALWNSANVYDKDGETLLATIAQGQDITERKKAEEALRESEERLRLSLDSSDAGVWEWDLRTNQNVWSEEIWRLYGLKPHCCEPSYDVWRATIHPDDREMVERTVQEAARNGGEMNFEYRVMGEGGTVRWLICRGRPLLDMGGNPVRFIGIVIDITERKLAEEALRNSERLYRAVGESIDYGVWVCDPDGRNIYASESFLKLVGLTQQQCSDFGWGNVLHPDDAERTIAAWKECVRRGGTWDIEHRFKGVDGQYHPVLARGVPVKDDNGKIIYWAGINLDINKIKQAEEALRETRDYLDSLIKYANAPIIVWDPAFSIMQFNHAFERLSGYEAGEVVGKNLRMLFPSDSVDESLEKIRDTLSGERWESVEIPILRRDGNVRIALWNSANINDNKGELLATIAQGQDITERKRAEEALRGSEANLARAQRIARLGNWTWNVKCDRVEGSAEFFRMFGFANRQHITYDEFIATLHPGDRERVEGAVRSALSGTTSYSVDYRVVLPDGVERIIHAEGEVTQDNAGQPVTMFGTVQDTTELKKAEEELANAKAQAELYLDLMGHDINNLNQVAQGYLELMDGMVEDEKLKELIAKPLDAVNNSSRLIENVRKVQKARTGQLKVEAVDLNKILSELQAQYSKAPGKDVTIHYTRCPGCVVTADGLIKDVFSNLMWNAIKHSNVESVHVNLELKRQWEDGKEYCRVTVEDNGQGIPEAEKEKVFARFQRGNTKASGKGLGLYLVKTLVEGYQGRVWVEDRVQGDHSKGARFVVMLPAV
jgi:PAS domain S-box-containing protein